MAGEEELPPLRDHELEELISRCPAGLRTLVARLCREVRVLREQASERQYMAEQEIEY